MNTMARVLRQVQQTSLTNGVDISTATVILGQISPQALVHVCTSQDQQKAIPAAKFNAGCDKQQIFSSAAR